MDLDFSAVTAEQVTRHIGARIRERRRTLGQSTESLGQALGVSVQQIQKYECGTDRIPASYLFLLATTLEVTIEFFYAGLPTMAPLPAAGTPPPEDLPELLRAYCSIDDAPVRRELTGVLRALLPVERRPSRRRRA